MTCYLYSIGNLYVALDKSPKLTHIVIRISKFCYCYEIRVECSYATLEGNVFSSSQDCCKLPIHTLHMMPQALLPPALPPERVASSLSLFSEKEVNLTLNPFALFDYTRTLLTPNA